jgi:heme-degrading monooxygenase HmoA
MIAAIAEIFLKDDQLKAYEDFATMLKPLVDKIEGFVSNERFQSTSNPNKILSLSFWSDEQSIREFRNLELHRLAEVKGREGIFSNYRIRIANVNREYGMFDRKDAPDNYLAHHGKAYE